MVWYIIYDLFYNLPTGGDIDIWRRLWNKLPQTLQLQGLIKMSIFSHKISFRFCPMYWIVLVAVWQTFKVVTASNTKAWVGVVGRGGSKCLRNCPSWWLTSDLRGEETQAICWIFTANITCSPAWIKLQGAVSTTLTALVKNEYEWWISETAVGPPLICVFGTHAGLFRLVKGEGEPGRNRTFKDDGLQPAGVQQLIGDRYRPGRGRERWWRPLRWT